MALAWLALAGLGGSSAWAATWRVGTSQDDPATIDTVRIQDAIEWADPGDTIIVNPGRYQEILFMQGKDLHVRSTDPTDPTIVAATILDAGFRQSAIRFSGVETEACIIEGLTIRNGRSSNGGAINGQGEEGIAAPTVRFNRFEQNRALGLGGAIYASQGPIANNTFTGNSALRGGALAICPGTVRNNVMEANAAVEGGAAYLCNGDWEKNILLDNRADFLGGAISNSRGELRANVFEGNRALEGGALYLYRGEMEGNQFIDNRATGEGGALFRCRGETRGSLFQGNRARNGGAASQSLIDFSNSRFLDNQADINGGALYLSTGAVEESHFEGNTAKRFGGAIDHNNLTQPDSPGPIRRNRFLGNVADQGGAVARSMAVIHNNRFEGNTATEGGALFACDRRIHNNLLQANQADRGGAVAASQAVFEHNTFAHNRADRGGAMLFTDAALVRACVFYNDSPQTLFNDVAFTTQPQPVILECALFAEGGPLYEDRDGLTLFAIAAIQERLPGSALNFSEPPGLAMPAGSDGDPATFHDNDLRPTTGSRLIDYAGAAIMASLPQSDLEGHARLVGDRTEPGCFEFGGRPDRDGDGLDDAAELAQGTDPDRADTDGDGLADGLERLRMLDPATRNQPGRVNVPGPLGDLQAALTLALTSETLNLAPGTYAGPLVMGTAVTLAGPEGNGAPTAWLSGLNATTALRLHPTTSTLSTTATLLRIGVRDGRARRGAAIHAAGGLLGLNQCHITSNTALTGGPVEDGLGRIESSRFDANTGGNGGALNRWDGPITNNIIEANTASRGAGLFDCDGLITQNQILRNRCRPDGDGAGLAWCDGEIAFNRIVENSARIGGGMNQCDALIHNNEFRGNFSPNGAAIANSIARIEHNWIVANVGANGGGIANCIGGIVDNVITDNVAGSVGGGIYRGRGEIRGNLVARNTARLGGGLGFCSAGTIDNQIVDNTAEDSGGGVYRHLGELRGNLIARNQADIGGGLQFISGPVNFNVITRNTARIGGAAEFCLGPWTGNQVTHNTATERGGAIVRHLRTLGSNVFSGNRAPLAVVLSGCTGPVQHNTFANNRAEPAPSDGIAATALDCEGPFDNNIFADAGLIAMATTPEANPPVRMHGNVFGKQIASWLQGDDGMASSGVALRRAGIDARDNAGMNPGFIHPEATPDQPADYRLRFDSLLIDRAEPAKNGPGSDAEGSTRWIDGDFDGHPRPDPGAYEFKPQREPNPRNHARRWTLYQ